MATLFLQPKRLHQAVQKLNFYEVMEPPPLLEQKSCTGLLVLSPTQRLNFTFLKISVFSIKKNMVDTSYKRNMQSWFSVEVCNPMVLAFEYSDTKWTGSQQQTENLMSMSTNM